MTDAMVAEPEENVRANAPLHSIQARVVPGVVRLVLPTRHSDEPRL